MTVAIAYLGLAHGYKPAFVPAFAVVYAADDAIALKFDPIDAVGSEQFVYLLVPLPGKLHASFLV